MKRLTVWLAAILIATTLTLIATPTPPATAGGNPYCRKQWANWHEEVLYPIFHRHGNIALPDFRTVRLSSQTVYKFCRGPLLGDDRILPYIKVKKTRFCYTWTGADALGNLSVPVSFQGVKFNGRYYDDVTEVNMPKKVVKKINYDLQRCRNQKILPLNRRLMRVQDTPRMELNSVVKIRFQTDKRKIFDMYGDDYMVITPYDDDGGEW